MTSRLPLIIPLLILAACEGPAGTNGTNGTSGVDGVNGIDGINGIDGVDGDNGTNGDPGQDGQDGEDLMAEPASLDFEITGVTVSGAPVVTFTATNEDGDLYNGLDQSLVDDRSIRWTIAKLVPGEDGDADAWQSYVNTTEDTSSSTAGPDDVPVLSSATQATTDSGGTLAYVGDGTYTYTFGTDITAVTSPIAVDYEEGLLHRVVMQFDLDTSTDTLISNPYFDWVPNGDTAPATRDMVSVTSCNECHTDLALHGGGRIETQYCVMCHNPGTTDANSGNTVDFKVMIHKIHMGRELPSVDNGDSYTIWGYRDGEHDYSEVGFPQDQENCSKCHDPDDTDTPDAINYLERPTMEACGSCHDDIDFTDPNTAHPGGDYEDNSVCSTCHKSDDITGYHATNNVTDHNPQLPDGYAEIQYGVTSATVDSSGSLTVDFTLTYDGTAFDAGSLPSDLTGSPTFVVAWAEAMDGYANPVDFNNLGNKAGQPDTYKLSDLVSGSNGSQSYAAGVNTVIIDEAYPEGATLRTVALQGYYSQTVDGSSAARHAKSTYTTVSGDDERREVVAAENCSQCHEWFEGHGGNRVYEVRVCTMCHQQALTSSGRELDIDNPEASNNFKDLIHGIHGASQRDYPLEFVRNRNGGIYYAYLGSDDQLADYPEGEVITFPNNPARCDLCHVNDSQLPENIPAGAFMSTQLVGMDATDISNYSEYRETVPNDDDLVMGPTAAACGGCHNSDAAYAHMDQNGGSVLWTRAETLADEPYEACTICHGDGKLASVAEMHDL